MCDHQLGVFTEGLGVPLKTFVSNEAAGVLNFGNSWSRLNSCVNVTKGIYFNLF